MDQEVFTEPPTSTGLPDTVAPATEAARADARTSASLRTSRANTESGSATSLHLVVASLIFLAAFLSFLVQPLAARYLLPKFGGGSSVWTICLVFFQSTLTIGYAYAHLVARHVPRQHQTKLHAALLLASLLTIPIFAEGSLEGSSHSDPAVQLLVFLCRTVGLPFMLLAGTSPLVQSWYAQVKGHATYRLYGLSNLGSLLGLLAYPFALEPFLGLQNQSRLWSVMYAALALLAVANWRAFSSIASNPAKEPIEHSHSPTSTTVLGRCLWFAIPACASMLLLASSSRMTQDIAPIPLLWVLPIGLYLLAFALAFSGRTAVVSRTSVALAASGLAGSLALMFLRQQDWEPNILVTLGVGMATVYFVCRVLFGELYRLRPSTDSLTSFYLAISIGGALGGAFVGLLAPRIFNGYWELHLAFWSSVLLVGLCMLSRRKKSAPNRRKTDIVGLVGVLLVLESVLLFHGWQETTGALLTRRGFYGVLSVHPSGEFTNLKYSLYHGQICHGVQFAQPGRRREPTSYYGRTTGVGQVLSNRSATDNPERRIAVIGLGVGSVAVYGEAGDHIRFYEIDPEIERIAREDFYYLSDSKAEVEVVLGDARVSLQSELETQGSQKFDVLIIDAFSGDAIPVHLLTREAYELYWSHLNPDGVLLVHTTNRYLELAPVARALAEDRGLQSAVIQREEATASDYWCEWVIVSSNQEMLALAELPTNEADPAELEISPYIWTDDHSHFLRALMLTD